jgi:hypothetical protein
MMNDDIKAVFQVREVTGTVQSCAVLNAH